MNENSDCQVLDKQTYKLCSFPALITSGKIVQTAQWEDLSNNGVNALGIIIDIHKWPVGSGEGVLMFHLCPAP